MSRVALSILATLLLSACQPAVDFECVASGEDLPPGECETVASVVANAKPGHQIGDLQTVSVELLGCTAEEGRAFFMSKLADPNVDRCWLVVLHYEGGDLERVAFREFGGPIQVQ
jgi:hypothetical protein